MSMRHFKSLLTGSVLALFLMTGQAQAALFDFSLTGTIDDDSFGLGPLEIGSTISVTGQYDDSPLLGIGSEFIDFAIAGNFMDIIAGGTIFSDAEDPFAALFFFDGGFDAIEYASLDFSLFLGGFVADIDFVGSNFFSSFGTWNDDFVATAARIPPPNVVPIPAAVWLFGTALIGMAGFSKRKKAKI